MASSIYCPSDRRDIKTNAHLRLPSAPPLLAIDIKGTNKKPQTLPVQDFTIPTTCFLHVIHCSLFFAELLSFIRVENLVLIGCYRRGDDFFLACLLWSLHWGLVLT